MNNRLKDRLNKAIELNKQQAEFYNNISLKEDVELFTGYGRNESANFVTKIFNPRIQSKIDKNIANLTKKIALEVTLKNEQNHYQHKVESKQKQNQGLWSKGIKSNASWGQNFKTIEDKK